MLRYVSACEHGSWHLMLHKKGEPETVRPYRFRCRSWRHKGECSKWRAAQDWTRIRDAMGRLDCWVYVVLTFKQSEWWDWRAQYQLACPYWSLMRKRLTREYGRIHYIQTWERHRKQGLHVNLLIGNEGIWYDCERNADEWQDDILRPMCLDIGFGQRTFAQCLRTDSEDQMAGYLTKLADELVGADNKCQVPFDAPPHFRRLRASRGLLDPPHKSDMTGYLVFHPDGEIGWKDPV